MGEFSYEPYIYRGALGGVVGYLLLVLLIAAYIWASYGDAQSVKDVLLIGGVLGLVSGAIAGCAIGFIIWRVTRKIRREPGGLTRTLIGSGTFLIYSLLLDFSAGRAPHRSITLAFAVLAGGLPGILAHAKSAQATSYGTKGRA